MKKLLKWLGLAIAVVVTLLGGAAVYVGRAPIPHYPIRKVEFPVDVTPERIARGRRSVEALCASCHLDSQTGALTGRRMPDLPAQFGEAYSLNITSHPTKGIGGWTDGELAYLLRTGVARDGRYTPPWMVKLPNTSDEDLRDIIAFLRSDDPLVQARDVDNRPSRPSFLTRLLCRVDFKPFAWPAREITAPAPEDEVAYGRYLVDAKFLCYGCHSADFKTLDEAHPPKSPGYLAGGNPMPDAGGAVVRTANLTPDEATGIGRWTSADFRRALVEGIRPDNRPLRFPMVPFRSLTDAEVGAIYAYLRSVPPARNAVAPPQTMRVEGERGKQVYYAYGCSSCHGDSGQGQYDLRKGPEKYPSDEALIAWIKHPERERPGIAMPTWEGVIQEEEYAPLAGYVRSLAKAAASGR
jgi:mono/diheme cytochrome c family protein